MLGKQHYEGSCGCRRWRAHIHRGEEEAGPIFTEEGKTSAALPCTCLVPAWVPPLGPPPQAEIFSSWFSASKIFTCCLVLSQQVAKKMNLDMRKTSSLWKDQALVEINIAVLYSFQVGELQGLGHRDRVGQRWRLLHKDDGSCCCTQLKLCPAFLLLSCSRSLQGDLMMSLPWMLERRRYRCLSSAGPAGVPGGQDPALLSHL